MIGLYRKWEMRNEWIGEWEMRNEWIGK